MKKRETKFKCLGDLLSQGWTPIFAYFNPGYIVRLGAIERARVWALEGTREKRLGDSTRVQANERLEERACVSRIGSNPYLPSRSLYVFVWERVRQRDPWRDRKRELNAHTSSMWPEEPIGLNRHQIVACFSLENVWVWNRDLEGQNGGKGGGAERKRKLEFDWCCFHYSMRNRLVALLEALLGRICWNQWRCLLLRRFYLHSQLTKQSTRKKKACTDIDQSEKKG